MAYDNWDVNIDSVDACVRQAVAQVYPIHIHFRSRSVVAGDDVINIQRTLSLYGWKTGKQMCVRFGTWMSSIHSVSTAARVQRRGQRHRWCRTELRNAHAFADNLLRICDKFQWCCSFYAPFSTACVLVGWMLLLFLFGTFYLVVFALVIEFRCRMCRGEVGERKLYQFERREIVCGK